MRTRISTCWSSATRAQQPLQRDVLQLVAADLGDLGLGHAGQGGNLGLGELALVDQIVELDGELRLGGQIGGVVKAEVMQNIQGAGSTRHGCLLWGP